MGTRTRPFDERREPDERPGNTPVEQQERDPSEVERTRPYKRAITGPGAADFLAAQGGEDLPGVSPGKGTSELREQTSITDPKNLAPRLAPEVEPPEHERTHYLTAEDVKKTEKE